MGGGAGASTGPAKMPAQGSHRLVTAVEGSARLGPVGGPRWWIRFSDVSAEPFAPSGTQHEITQGRHRAVVTEVGATLRVFTVDGDDVIDGFAVDERCSGGRGQVLAPWPNRLGDGRYSFQDRQVQAALDEPALANAIHGLTRWLPWVPISRSESAVVLGCVLHPQPGYPWRLRLQVEYRLSGEGLTVTTEATNLSEETAPFGLGFHPYVTVGTTIDTVRLILPARRRLLADTRALPTGDTAVAGSEFDFAAGRTVGSIQLDTCYTDLVRDGDGRARARLERSDGGRRVTVWVDGAFGYLMAFTGDTVQPPERRRAAMALEPMTCPPDALRSGRDVILLAPGAPWRASWGIAVDGWT
jgi:aldose 1-epimerase